MKAKEAKVIHQSQAIHPQKFGIVKILHGLEHVALLIIVPPDGGYYAWMVVFAAFITNFLSDGVFFSFGKLIGEISEHLNRSQSEIASIFSAMTAFYYISGPFASAFVNRYGFRLAGTLGVLTSSVCVGLSSISNSYLTLLVLHAIAGIGFGATSLSVVLCTGYHFDKYRPIATGLATSGSGAGIFAVEKIINHLILNHETGPKHWRLFMRYEAILVICCLIPVFLFRAPPAQKLISEVEDLNSQKKDRAQTSVFDDTSSEEDVEDGIKIFTIGRPSAISRNSHLSFHAYPTVSEITPDFHVFTATKQKKISLLQNLKNWRSWCKSTKKKATKIQEIDVSRPLYRDDILYPGTLGNLPQSRRQTRVDILGSEENTLHLQLSITRMPSKRPSGKFASRFLNHIIPAFKILFDMSLLRSYTFLLLLLNGLLYIFGGIIPITFITERAYLAGIEEENAMWLVSAIGLANIFGRITAGSLMIIPNMNGSVFIAIALMISGLSTIATGFIPVRDISWQLIYCVVYGLGQSAFVALRPIAYVQQLGLEKLTNAFGITSMFMGLSAAISVPILGSMIEQTGNYVGTFVVAGFSLLFAGLVLFLLPVVGRIEKKRADVTKIVVDE